MNTSAEMNSLDYLMMPDTDHWHDLQTLESIQKADAILIKRAEGIAKKMNANADAHTYRAMEQERKFVLAMGRLIDRFKTHMNWWNQVITNTKNDYFIGVTEGEKYRAKIQDLQDMVKANHKEIAVLHEIIRSQNKKLK